MLNLGFSELIVVVILAIVVVGPERLPDTLRFLGRQYGKLMRMSIDLRRAFLAESDQADAARKAAKIHRQREEASQRVQQLDAANASSPPGPDLPGPHAQGAGEPASDGAPTSSQNLPGPQAQGAGEPAGDGSPTSSPEAPPPPEAP